MTVFSSLCMVSSGELLWKLQRMFGTKNVKFFMKSYAIMNISSGALLHEADRILAIFFRKTHYVLQYYNTKIFYIK